MTKAHARNTADNDPVLTEAQRDAARRKLHDFLGFWNVCQLKRCRRGKGCRGEARACAARHFPMVPDEAKAWLYKACEGLRDGLSPQQACDDANKHIAAVNEVLARHRDADADVARTSPAMRSVRHRMRRRISAKIHRHTSVRRCACAHYEYGRNERRRNRAGCTAVVPGFRLPNRFDVAPPRDGGYSSQSRRRDRVVVGRKPPRYRCARLRHGGVQHFRCVHQARRSDASAWRGFRDPRNFHGRASGRRHDRHGRLAFLALSV
jgi:hypothetical protein